VSTTWLKKVAQPIPAQVVASTIIQPKLSSIQN